MKNKKIIEAWDKINPDKKTQERMLTGVLNKVQTNKKGLFSFSYSTFVKLLTAATVCGLACLVLVFPGPLPKQENADSEKTGLQDSLFLESADGIVVTYIKEAPSVSIFCDLQWLSEEQLFHDFETVIFEGVVVDTRNIKISLEDYVEYRAIARIKVTDVIRGDLSVNDSIKVLLQTPIAMEMTYWVEDTEVESEVKAGTKGIFMLRKYGADESVEIEGKELYYSKLADYHFLDGRRFAFLEKENGLLFAREAYESIANAKSLTEIKKYIYAMIYQYGN